MPQVRINGVDYDKIVVVNKEGGDISGGGPGPGPSGNSGKAIGLLLDDDLIVNVEQILEVPFAIERFNDGFTWDDTEKSVEVPFDGTVIITCDVGAVVPQGMESALTVASLVYKNGLPLRQNSTTKATPPYCTAAVTVIDKCVAGDKYVMYVTGTGGGALTYTVGSTNGITGMEIAYL